MITWELRDSALAALEGWDVFHVNSDQFEIQRCDEADIFTEDPIALFHVYDKALRGSELHRKALLFVLDESNIRPTKSKT